jgi:aminoglycoside 6'-N-acetyltransferase I
MAIHQLVPNDPFFDDYCRLRIALWPDCAGECAYEAEKQIRDLDAGAAFLALNDRQQPIGFVEVSLRSVAESATISPVPFIEGWFVEADYRRQGVGRALVRAAEDWAEARGFSEIASDAQLENTGSIAAHLQLGYREVERNVCFLKQLLPQ